ncbi:metallopeptidase family protein [Patescibacteria group bacterium]|nr:metallopeptidase family protein [Patescibacteria group bacterium]
MDQQIFEKYIKQAINQVPKELRDKIKNLAFVVEDNVRTASSNERIIKTRGVLLGLYQGVPLPNRSGYYSGVLPDKITIFKKPIEQLAGYNEQKMAELIHEVVHHEIGHYFGMSENQVRAWERKRKNQK